MAHKSFTKQLSFSATIIIIKCKFTARTHAQGMKCMRMNILYLVHSENAPRSHQFGVSIIIMQYTFGKTFQTLITDQFDKQGEFTCKQSRERAACDEWYGQY